MKKLSLLAASISAAILLSACSNAPKLATQAMPRSGFLPDYSLLVPMATNDPDARIWRYRVSGVNPGSYTAVILEPIYLNQNATKDVSPEVINKAKAAVEAAVEANKDAVKSRELLDRIESEI